jgi:hypothetical protein
MDNAEHILRNILKDKYQGIVRFITDGQEENLWLDFKEESDPSRIGISGDDRRNYARALSGFSNSLGGVVVWGIKARKEHEHAPDVACELKPIKSVKRYLTDLNSLTGSALVPINHGVQNYVIYVNDDESKDEGFVVTYVPETSGLPHRAMCKENIYYTRSGDSFYIMEHHQLADMFGKRQKPDLHLFYRLEKTLTGNKYKIYIIVGIENKGRYLATYPALRIKPGTDLRLSQFSVNGNSGGWPLAPQIQSRQSITNNGTLFAGGINNAIHPQERLEVVTLSSMLKFSGDQFLFRKNLDRVVYSFRFDIFCEGGPTKSGEIEILEAELAKFIEE